MPISFFEVANNPYYGAPSLASLDADGEMLGLIAKNAFLLVPYRGEVLFQPRRHRLQGLGHRLCTDRLRHLLGSVVPGMRPRYGPDGRRNLLYPTAIGSEPNDPEFTTAPIIGSVPCGAIPPANMIPVVASNSVGREDGADLLADFLQPVVYRRGPVGELLIAAAGDEESDRDRTFHFRAPCGDSVPAGACSVTAGPTFITVIYDARRPELERVITPALLTRRAEGVRGLRVCRVNQLNLDARPDRLS